MAFNILGKHVIVLGDKTTHGGEVITGSENFSYLGKPVARVGDKVSCPKCNGVFEITEGVASAFDHGNRIAVHDCLTSCGAKLIACSAMADEKPSEVMMAASTVTMPGRLEDPRQPQLKPLPKAPPPLEDYQMQPFHQQAEKQGLGDRKTLAQYHKVASGLSINSSHSNGWDNDKLPINGEALVYVKNINPPIIIGMITNVNVQAGILGKSIESQSLLLPSQTEHIFRFINSTFGHWYISVDAPTDVYMLQVEIWTRGSYAK